MTSTVNARTGRAPVAGLLLAAGGGRRLGGRPKALLPHRGGLLVEHALRVLREGGCGPVHVVLGAGAEKVRARLGPAAGVVLVDHPGWADGMGTSLRAGLASLTAAGTDASAALVALVDQPRVGARAVARVLAAHREGAELAAAAYEGVRGHPVLLAREHWDGVARAATGDRGARDYLRQHASLVRLVECSDVAAPDDVDTPDDLALLD
ncbi:4-diphosphocytidyl-2C-methyl-D-erythritol synthase [Streptomyces cinnamoneus]|uniref:4-diphosphocytidyl-2C-methyl-D-erythritol synthase n=1 Tax=Streptomyces cinnamoneus TaxID=53446 RepID=A0A2G1XA47_STRCJ|nr:nucleotidyltransferase family protein [Streptomyces cinnamoneus]PHQ48092.1 4-diphosphocytidyl-2C-methyl-D-erythritol synthase [Streptomyces cinnamoneus]PPT15718.1 nucleotidyltransferase family protein [Streptomyces cinnamoneus]